MKRSDFDVIAFGADLCRALGQDPGKTQGIDLRLRVGEFPECTITKLVCGKEGEAVKRVLTRYTFTVQRTEDVGSEDLLVNSDGLVDVTPLGTPWAQLEKAAL